MTNPTLLKRKYLLPRYWPAWMLISMAWLVSRLPLRARWAAGSLVGRLGYHLAISRRHIVETNFALCMPELSENERRELTRENFRSTGISLIETATVWFQPAEKYRRLVDIEGLSQLKAAHARGKGVLMLGMHLSTLDFCGAVLGTEVNFDVMYRRSKNALIDAIMTRGRERHFTSAIERSNVRQVIRRLKEGAIVWYGPDQDYGPKLSVFAEFFGQTAATITAPARIARMTGAPVVILSHYRDLETGRYRIVLSEPLANYPSDDESRNCQRINDLVESCVRQAPEQYWWLHRRFKSTPPGVPRPYDGRVR